MLKQVLHEIEATQGAINLNELSHKLGIERSALEGMIQFWVRKGRLKDNERENEQISAACDRGCNGGCSGPQGCLHGVNTPRTFSLTLYDD